MPAASIHAPYDPETWVAAKREMRDVLIETARRGQTIAYSELASRIQTISFHPQEPAFAAMLGEISEEEDQNGRGMLTVLVVHQGGDMRPGPGFFHLAQRLGRDVADLDRTWVEEFKKVTSHWQN
jgi:hypothetical protein